MNIAFLIAAHKDEQQLFRLVKKLLTIGNICTNLWRVISKLLMLLTNLFLQRASWLRHIKKALRKR